MPKKIYSLDLMYAGTPASFVIRMMDDIFSEQEDFLDFYHSFRVFSISGTFLPD